MAEKTDYEKFVDFKMAEMCEAVAEYLFNLGEKERHELLDKGLYLDDIMNGLEDIAETLKGE